MTTPAPAPAGPTTIPEATLHRCKLYAHFDHAHAVCGPWCAQGRYDTLTAELARERRRCEALVKAGEAMAVSIAASYDGWADTPENRKKLQTLIDGLLANWDAAKALQGQDGAGGVT
jgi:hypothetical protein